MATFKQHATTLRDVGHDVSFKMGYDLRQAELPMRALFTTICVLIGGVMRVLSDKAVATDAEMNAVFTEVRDADYPQLPTTAPPVNEDGTVPPPPDLGE